MSLQLPECLIESGLGQKEREDFFLANIQPESRACVQSCTLTIPSSIAEYFESPHLLLETRDTQCSCNASPLIVTNKRSLIDSRPIDSSSRERSVFSHIIKRARIRRHVYCHEFGTTELPRGVRGRGQQADQLGAIRQLCLSVYGQSVY